MKISEKNKDYLMKAYKILKIVGNVCAVAFLCLWCFILIIGKPKGECFLSEIVDHSCMSWYLAKKMIFLIVNAYIIWKMVGRLPKIQPLKYHIVFWLAPFVILLLQQWILQW